MDSYQDGTTMFTDLIAIEKMVTVDALQTQCMVYMHISHAGAAVLLFLVLLQTCTQAHDTVVMITFFHDFVIEIISREFHQLLFGTM